MKITHFATVLLVAAQLGTVAQAHEVKTNRDAMHARVDQMEKMMDRAAGMHGAKRKELLRNHMSMMQDQMSDMHGMMSGHGGMMGRSGSGPNSGMGHNLEEMQERMNQMQKMMEHMVRQQKMMMDSE